MTATILVFDSGIGGISVLREIRSVLPSANFVYVADDAGFPYGDWEEAALCRRIIDLFSGLIKKYRPDVAVIACNTASTLVLPGLRDRYEVPFVGTVPAIKPAATETASGLISVLATPGTVQREYTFDLIAQFAPDVAVSLVGSTGLAALAEAHVRGDDVDRDAIAAEIAPCFVTKDGLRTDIVVLACTHYPLLADLFCQIAPWPVRWIDPAPAIARRVAQLFDQNLAAKPVSEDGGIRSGNVVFTSGRKPASHVSSFLAEYGLKT